MMPARNVSFEYVCYPDRKDEFKDMVEKGGRTNMLAAGDSWFRYMGQGYEGLNVIEQLSYFLHNRKKFPHCILNLAMNGSHSTHWAGEGSRYGRALSKCLDELPGIEYLLFSGGGNDIIDELPETPPEDIEQGVSEIIADGIEPSYKLLLGLCAYKNVKMIAHCYSPAKGEGPATFLGIPLAGPWLDEYNEEQKDEVETQTVEQMKSMLLQLQKDYGNLLFADTSGLQLKEEDWNDQIHLNRRGCKKVAEVFIEEILGQ